MQVLPPTTPPPAATAGTTTSPASGGDGDDGFLAILAEALTAVSDQLDGAAGDDDAVAEESATADDPAESAVVDQTTGPGAVPATFPTTGDADAAGILDEPRGDDRPTDHSLVDGSDSHTLPASVPALPTPTPPTAVSDDDDPVGHVQAQPSPAVDGRADAGSPPVDLAGTTGTDAEGPVVAPLRVPSWVASADEPTSTPAGARSEPAALGTMPVAGPAATGTVTTPSPAPAQPASVAAAMAAADVASFEAIEAESPWEQLATVVRPLRQMADGTHRLSLQLRPAELGAVHLEVALEDGRLSLRATAENLATRDVLAASLPDLRAALARSGIDLGSLDVGDQTFGADPGETEQGGGIPAPARSGSRPQPGAAVADSTPALDPSADGGPSRLDLTL